MPSADLALECKKNMTFREKKAQRHFSIKPGASCLNAISFKARSVTMDH